jgi:hypothetical protein
LKGVSPAQDAKLSEALEPSIFESLDDDENVVSSLQTQYEGVLADRESLRYEVFRTHYDDTIHLPINLQ